MAIVEVIFWVIICVAFFGATLLINRVGNNKDYDRKDDNYMDFECETCGVDYDGRTSMDTMECTSKPVIFSTGCPRCKIAVGHLTKEGLDFDICTDEGAMYALEIQTVPVLMMDNKFYTFHEIMENAWKHD